MISTRRATVADLPAVHQLIRESFSAMKEHSCFGADFWERGAQGLIESELSEQEFEGVYFGRGSNHFWVAVRSSDAAVVGCVGLKAESSSKAAELVRMAVSESQRSQGVGAVLMQTLLAYAKSNGVAKVHLTTGNPRSAQFYKKHGFELYNRWLFIYMERVVV